MADIIAAMGNFLGGLLVALAIATCAASSANAALIPPTAECEVTFKKVLRIYNKDISGKPSKTEVARADRKFAETLAAGGCVSDAEPIVELMPAKPFTAQCKRAAPQAQASWGSTMKRFTRMGKRFSQRVLRPFRQRSKTLARKIRRSKDLGYARQTAILVHKRNELKRNFKKRERLHGRKFEQLIRDRAYSTLLVLYELVSLRCLDAKSFEENAGRGPVSRVVERNFFLIFTALILAFEESDDSHSVSVSKAGLPTVNSAPTRISLPGPHLNP
ncbi:MAG: hypothetical protein M3Y23_05770 [Actinomycetota bacterium]|nr:hypothetical protein [Actinomycetota bacterium]